jgi:copper chaperone CopZ
MKFSQSLVTILLLFNLNSIAAFKSAMVGVNGLTCSACTRSVEMAIRKLDFVKDVQMNLENTEGKIIFRDSLDIDIEKVAQAVVNAGFSVRYLTAVYDFNNVTVKKDFCFNDGKNQFAFINTDHRVLNGEITLKFIGKQFLPKSDFNKMKPLPASACTNTSLRTYFVTL